MGGTKCVECKKENKAAKTACGHPKNEVKQCQGWKKSGYCDDNHKFAHIVQQCKKENEAAKTACGHPKNEVKQCQGWQRSGYCDDNHKFAYIVQRSCLYVCEICTE